MVAQIFESRQKPVSNWVPCGRKAEILPSAPTAPARFQQNRDGDATKESNASKICC